MVLFASGLLFEESVPTVLLNGKTSIGRLQTGLIIKNWVLRSRGVMLQAMFGGNTGRSQCGR